MKNKHESYPLKKKISLKLQSVPLWIFVNFSVKKVIFIKTENKLYIFLWKVNYISEIHLFKKLIWKLWLYMKFKL